MPRKITHVVTGVQADDAIQARIKAGRQMLGGQVLTEQEIVFSKGLRRVYLPMNEITWAFRRVEESHVTLGCCGGVLQEFHIILRHTSGQEVKVTFDREQNAIAALDHIAALSAAAIGYTEENKVRFLSLAVQ